MATAIAKVEVSCPECGHVQMESENFISTVCRKCSFYFKSPLVLGSSKKKMHRSRIQKRELTCADCGAVQMVAEEAQSSSCLECGRHLELGHRLIEGELLGNLSLEGELEIGPRGNFGGTKARAARILLKGRASGFLEAAEWLRVEGQAKIRLGAKGGQLLISEGAVLEAEDSLTFQSAKIEGELRCEKLIIEGAVWIGPRARVVVERIVFGEMTLESGGRLCGFGEVKTPEVEAESELPQGELATKTSTAE